MDDSCICRCPYCGQFVEMDVDPQTNGDMIQDCDVCCRPWQVHVQHDELGDPHVQIERSY